MSKWAKSRTANLIRYIPSGVYFMSAKVGGRHVRRSLRTTSEEIARSKLRDRLAAERVAGGVADAGGTFEELGRAYIETLRGKGRATRTVEYAEECLRAIGTSFKEVTSDGVRLVNRDQVFRWAAVARKRYSAPRFNGLLGTLRAVFSRAVQSGFRLDNPAAGIERARVGITAPRLPSVSSFQTLLKRLDSNPQAEAAAVVVRLLAFTGLRINEARNLEPGDVDFSRGFIHARKTKGGIPRHVPIIAECEPVLKLLISKHPGPPFGLLPIDSPRKALNTACKKAGIEMTPHDLRHLFATRCLEAGVDVPTVANWLGHKDGGALLLKRYSHLRDQHSAQMAKKVTFNP